MNQNQKDWLRAKIIEFGTPLALEFMAKVAKTNPDARAIVKHVMAEELNAVLDNRKETGSHHIQV
tara:strand:- start:2104 stop:2298 length:195 start_codon:yes stop_codon:yes gene_type:complete